MLDVQDLFVLGPGEGLLTDLVILGDLLLEDWAQCSRQHCPAQGMPGTQPAHTEPGPTSSFPVQSLRPHGPLASPPNTHHLWEICGKPGSVSVPAAPSPLRGRGSCSPSLQSS